MSRWAKGAERVTALIEARHLQHVAGDPDTVSALLNHQGLRPTTAGGHIAVVDTIRAQFPGVPGLTSPDRLRRRRNQAEYPDLRSYDPITPEEANDAIRVAGDCVTSAEPLLILDELDVF